MTRTRSILAWVVAGVAVAAVAPSVGQSPGRAGGAASGGAEAALSSRLAALDPGDPMGYFRLAEEIAESGPAQGSPARRAAALSLARRLLVLSADLCGRRGSAEFRRLRSSAYLALAWLAESPEERRWLGAVASTFEPAPESVRWEPAPRVLEADAGAYELAVALGRYRSGEFRRARDTLRRHPNAADLLARAGIDSRRSGELLSLLETDTARAPQACMRCKGGRVLRSFAEDGGGFVTELCPQCLGNPAPVPALSAGAFAEHLRVEAALLGATPTSWSAQTRVIGSAPLRDIDPGAVAAHYGVDLNAPVYRDGSWVPQPP